MQYYTEIYVFWKDHPEYWITLKNKSEVDNVIYQKFYRGNISFESTFKTRQSLIGYIIYLDQLQRHFFRYLDVKKDDLIRECRRYVIDIINKNIIFKDLEDWELIFCLMPYKHLQNYEKVLLEVLNWCKNKNINIKDNKLISDFFNDTYKKKYTCNKIKEELITAHPLNVYSCKDICEYYPFDQIPIPENIELFKYNKDRAIISLSGGVDSMVMLYYLKKILKKDVEAIHIIYGNRKVSEQEYSFIASYCNRLDVKLHAYRIKYLKRSEIDREFYESITRQIRFDVYKSVIDIDDSILLGHIKDDLVENVWTNFARCQHLNNLQKMELFEVQLGVCIERPMLNISKDIIYKCSQIWKVPFLKDTTPSWSNRGKFRNNFYPSICLQYGKIDDKILEVSNFYKKQCEIVKKIIYKPILESFKDNRIDITSGLEADLDISGWLYIIENLCIQYLHIKKPSVNSIKNWCKRLKDKNILCQMRKEYKFRVYTENDRIYLQVVF